MYKSLSAVLLASLALGITALGPVKAQENGKRQPAISTTTVQFRKGASSATLTNKIRSYAHRDYTLSARAGQTISVSVKATNGSGTPYCYVFPADGTGSLTPTEVSSWSGTLPTTGRYVVRVFLMRAEARRNESAAYRLTIGVR